jgi:hypothetical protein
MHHSEINVDFDNPAFSEALWSFPMSASLLLWTFILENLRLSAAKILSATSALCVMMFPYDYPLLALSRENSVKKNMDRLYEGNLYSVDEVERLEKFVRRDLKLFLL